jgi:hypothetical protein
MAAASSSTDSTDPVVVDVDARTVTMPAKLPELPPMLRMQHHKAAQDLARELGVMGSRYDMETEARVDAPMRLVDLVQGYPAIMGPAYAYLRVRTMLGAKAPTVRQFLADWQVIDTAEVATDPTTPPRSGSSP